eukprot:1825675-Rhodomonas_salina.2
MMMMMMRTRSGADPASAIPSGSGIDAGCLGRGVLVAAFGSIVFVSRTRATLPRVARPVRRSTQRLTTL